MAVSYMLASPEYVLDVFNKKFIPIDRINRFNDVQVPFYLWDKKYTTLLRLSFCKPVKDYSIDFNGVYVEFDTKLKQGLDDDFGGHSVRIRYFDRIKSKFRTIVFDVGPRYGGVVGMHDWYLSSVLYDMMYAGHEDEFIVPVNWGLGTSYFPLSELFEAKCRCHAEPVDRFYFGVRSTPFGVAYKDHALAGKYYAFIFGTWALLLTDEFEFDSFVLLEGADDGLLRIERIIQTVNSEFVKAKMLLNI